MNKDRQGLEFGKLLELFKQTQTTMQTQAARSIDTALVVRNWLFGWYIVEFENGGAERAELYGKKLLQQLSTELKQLGLKGVSLTNLKQFRLFYETYKEISQALPDQSLEASVQELRQTLPAGALTVLHKPEILDEVTLKLAKRFILGWTHYVTLLTVKNAEERRFYEIEGAENNWGYIKDMKRYY